MKEWGHIKMVYRWADVEYEGFIFTVQGDWQDNCFQEYEVIYEERDVTDIYLFSDKTINWVVTQAEFKLMEMDNE